MKRAHLLASLCALAMASFAWSSSAAGAADRASARQRLHQQQLQDDLNLRLQQDMARGRAGASLRDRLELDALARRQRMEQQALQQEQSVYLQRFADDPHHLRQQERLYAHERDVQLQRFQMEQQRVLGSSDPPLQSMPRPGELELR